MSTTTTPDLRDLAITAITSHGYDAQNGRIPSDVVVRLMVGFARGLESQGSGSRPVYIVSTCIPGDRMPCVPGVFDSEQAAEDYLEEVMKSEWESNGPQDEETEERLPYPGNWRDAQDEIIRNDSDHEWGGYEIHISYLPGDTPPVRAAIGEIAKTEKVTSDEGAAAIANALIDTARAVLRIRTRPGVESFPPAEKKALTDAILDIGEGIDSSNIDKYRSLQRALTIVKNMPGL